MNQGITQKWHDSAMETRDHSKNGASLKSLMSKGKFKLFTILAFVAGVFVFTGCESNHNVPDNLVKIDDMIPTNVMASFAKATYNDDLYRKYELSVLLCSGDDWKLVHSRQVGKWNPLVTDFWYQIYESDKSIVIAFRGTPPLSINPAVYDNWVETLGLILGFDHIQDAYVKGEVKNGKIKDYLDTAKVHKKKVFLTGHSLGGHLAMIAYMEARKDYESIIGKVETFNAVGLKKSDAEEIEKNGVDKIRQHRTCCDIANYGSQVTIGGLGKLYFPAAERPIKPIVINVDNSTHECSATHSPELLSDILLNLTNLLSWLQTDTKDAKNGIMAHAIENFPFCDILVDPTTINPETGLTEDIHNIIPDDILKTFKELGTVINGGNNPPQIEGTYFVSPLTLVKSNVFLDAAPGTVYWINNGNMNSTFSEQNNTKLTVKLDYSIGPDEGGNGLGAFITGEDNKFSIFVEITGKTSGYQTRSVQIHSGEVANGGIKNYQFALIMVEGAPTTIPSGRGRLWKDGDGFSERK